jgi:hypothetical protein
MVLCEEVRHCLSARGLPDWMATGMVFRARRCANEGSHINVPHSERRLCGKRRITQYVCATFSWLKKSLFDSSQPAPQPRTDSRFRMSFESLRRSPPPGVAYRRRAPLPRPGARAHNATARVHEFAVDARPVIGVLLRNAVGARPDPGADQGIGERVKQRRRRRSRRHRKMRRDAPRA